MNNFPYDEAARVKLEMETQLTLQQIREGDRVREARIRNKLLPAMNSFERRLLVVLAVAVAIVVALVVLFS